MASQIARPNPEGRRYFDKRLADDKTKHEAVRALNRQISDRIWTVLSNPTGVIVSA